MSRLRVVALAALAALLSACTSTVTNMTVIDDDAGAGAGDGAGGTGGAGGAGGTGGTGDASSAGSPGDAGHVDTGMEEAGLGGSDAEADAGAGGSGGSAGSVSATCTLFPDCGGCVDCLETCLCQSGASQADCQATCEEDAAAQPTEPAIGRACSTHADCEDIPLGQCIQGMCSRPCSAQADCGCFQEPCEAACVTLTAATALRVEYECRRECTNVSHCSKGSCGSVYGRSDLFCQ